MNAIRPIRAAAAALALASHASAQPAPAGASDKAAIEQVLQASAKDWSRGDLSAFMRSYENAPETAFVTPQGLIKGYDALKSHYVAKYASGRNRMGQLALTILDERPLSADYALVTGRFAVARPAADGGDASGIFTLLMHRTALGWRISYDHTS